MIGVLALQGGFEAHVALLRECGFQSGEVRTQAELQACDGLVLPGGESTTVMLALERDGLAEPLRRFAKSDRPVLATCAGLIILAPPNLGVLNVAVARNAYGRQLSSFEARVPLRLREQEAEINGVFIRAPRISELGAGVEVLGELDGEPVAVRQEAIVATSFHPELAESTLLHREAFG